MSKLNKFIKQAQKMQSQMIQAQQKLQNTTVEGVAGGGAVKIVLNGASDIVSVSIKPEVVNPTEVEMLEDLIVAAFRNAQQKVKELTNTTMGSITGGMSIPGLV